MRILQECHIVGERSVGEWQRGDKSCGRGQTVANSASHRTGDRCDGRVTQGYNGYVKIVADAFCSVLRWYVYSISGRLQSFQHHIRWVVASDVFLQKIRTKRSMSRSRGQNPTCPSFSGVLRRRLRVVSSLDCCSSFSLACRFLARSAS